MNWILLVLFGASCLALICAPLWERSGFLQFPLLAGGGALGFLFFQAVGIVRNESLVPESGLTKTLVMCILCNIAVLLAWKQPVPKLWRRPTKWAYPLTKIYWIGIAFLAIGGIGEIKLITLAGGLTKSFSLDTEITEWQGLPVVYLYTAVLAHTGIVMVGLAALKMRRCAWRLAPAIPFLLLEVAIIAFGARRTPLVSLALTIFCIFYFSKRALPARPILIGFSAIAAAAMFIFPLIRGYTQIGGDRSQLDNIRVEDVSRDVVDGTRGEFWSAVYLVQITDTENLFMLGGGLYNDFIRYFVPKLLVGEEGKASLFLGIPDPQNATMNVYSWTKPNGFVPTGPASAFIQFSYAGALLFWLLARTMKYLWIRASQGDDHMAQCLYVLLLTPAMTALVNDFTGALYGNGLQNFIAPLIALLMIRSPIRFPLGQQRCTRRRCNTTDGEV